MNPPHVLVLPACLDCKWSRGGCFFLEQAVIMQRLADWKIRMSLPCAHHVIKVKRRNLPPANGVEVEVKDGVEIWFGYYPYYLPRKKRHARVHFGEKLFLQYIKKHGKPDFLWAHEIADSGYLARHLSRKYGVPYFVHEHTGYDVKKLSPIRSRRIYEVIKDSAYCAVVSDSQRRDMLRHIPAAADKIGVVHNPVGLNFSESVPALRRQNPFVFISTAYLRRGKNVNLIIRAFAEIHAEIGKCRLLLVGDGKLENELKNLVEKLNLSDFIIFTGAQNREQLCESLRTADAFVAASSSETFGLALAEAMVCGLPVITADVGIAGEVVTDSNGVLLESLSVECIAAAMRLVMQGNYDSAVISQKAKQQFAPESFARSVQENLSLMNHKAG